MNEWYTSKAPWWLFGPKNNMIMWIIAANLLSQISIMQRKYRKIIIFEDIKRNFFDYLVILATILTPALTKSSTSLFVMLILSSVILLKGIYQNVNTKMMVWIIAGMYVILSMTLYSMSSSNFLSFFAGLFGKDATFTGRTSAWASAIAMIIRKPVLGYGYISSKDMQSLLGASAFVNTHNTLLQILVNGGLVLGVVFVSYIVYLIKRITNAIQREKHIGVLLIIAMAALFIEMCFETFSTSEPYWLFLLLIGMIADRIISNTPQMQMVE